MNILEVHGSPLQAPYQSLYSSTFVALSLAKESQLPLGVEY